jgi:hypothetical protein
MEIPFSGYSPEVSMDIHTADTRTDLARFIRFPYQLYREAPDWVQPLRFEQ